MISKIPKPIIEIIQKESPKEEIKEMSIMFSNFKKTLIDVLFALIQSGYSPRVQFNNTLYKISLCLNKTNIQITDNQSYCKYRHV